MWLTTLGTGLARSGAPSLAQTNFAEPPRSAQGRLGASLDPRPSSSIRRYREVCARHTCPAHSAHSLLKSRRDLRARDMCARQVCLERLQGRREASRRLDGHHGQTYGELAIYLSSTCFSRFGPSHDPRCRLAPARSTAPRCACDPAMLSGPTLIASAAAAV